MNDGRVDLSALRTPPPLDEREYADVRARVMAKIRRREPARWPWLLPMAAAMLLMFVLVGRKTQDAPVLPRQAAPVVIASPQTTAAAPPVIAPPAVEERRPSPVKVVSSRPLAPRDSPPMRIHIETADPDVRIIWIIKEKS